MAPKGVDTSTVQCYCSAKAELSLQSYGDAMSATAMTGCGARAAKRDEARRQCDGDGIDRPAVLRRSEEGKFELTLKSA